MASFIGNLSQLRRMETMIAPLLYASNVNGWQIAESVGVVVAAIGTTVTAAISIFLIARERSDRRRSQARRVAIRYGEKSVNPREDGSGGATVRYSFTLDNNSSDTITDVRVTARIIAEDGTTLNDLPDEDERYSRVAQGETIEHEWDCGIRWDSDTNTLLKSKVRLDLWFTDAQGLKWHRTDHDRLIQLRR